LGSALSVEELLSSAVLEKRKPKLREMEVFGTGIEIQRVLLRSLGLTTMLNSFSLYLPVS